MTSYNRKHFIEDAINSVLLSSFKNIELYGQCYSTISNLRNDFRLVLNRLNLNPFNWFGCWVQKLVRGINLKVVLPEKSVDFELVNYSNFNKNQPFVLIIKATK